MAWLAFWDLHPHTMLTPFPCRYTTAGALAALADVPGSEGLQVAGRWLGELLVTISKQVKPYHSVAAVSPQALPSLA